MTIKIGYCKITCGLGNQLLQIATLLDYCKKYERTPIININYITTNHHQNYDKIKTINVLQKLFPNIKFDSEPINNYIELYETQEYWYKYKKFNNYDNTNIVFDGYFFSHKYFSEYNEIYKQINITPNNEKLLYFDFHNLYFIHIRLGDYILPENIIYSGINLKEFYNFSINKIKNLNANARFIICTNEYSQNLYNYIENFPQNNFYMIQDKTNDELDTLYIMSNCNGGICANSTFSYMGTYFQKNKNKNYIFMPYPYVKNEQLGFTKELMWDVSPEWATIYNTETNEIFN